MRLAVIGPAAGDRIALRKRAQFAMEELSPDRVLYLGIDDAFDDMVERWASHIVQGDPSDEAVWKRAAKACATANHHAIDAFLKRERKRAALKALATLPHAKARTIEVFLGLVCIIIHDKALLDEEDILPATLLVFGKSPIPMIHRVGKRVFVSPGPISDPDGGVALIAEKKKEILIAVHGADGEEKSHDLISTSRSARLTVQGAS